MKTITHRKYKAIGLILILLAFNYNLSSKNNPSFTFVDYLMHNIPDSITQSEDQIADFINMAFVTDEEKSRAIFYWIANNIQYDAENMFAFSIILNPNHKPAGILETRKGVCHDYVLLYKNIADRVGIISSVVTGYTKKKGRVSGNPHAWIATLINSKWYLTDPTWGAGYIDDGQFIKKFNLNYFKVDPETFIKTHIPFDPIWQLSNFPITKQQFQNRKTRKPKNTAYFNFADSIKKYESQSRIQRLESSRDRISENGITNYLDHDHLIHLQSKIVHHYRKMNETNYYSALSKYNEGVRLLNEYINLKSTSLHLIKNDSDIKEMTSNINNIFDNALDLLNKIDDSSSLSLLKVQLYKSIVGAKSNLNDRIANLHN